MSKEIPKIIDDVHWLRTHAQIDGVPADCFRAYTKLLNTSIGYFKGIIDHIIRLNGESILVPMQPVFIERYLTGFTFEYRPFSSLNELDQLKEGFWRCSDHDPSHVLIFYNQNATVERQRLTKIHELFHFMQSIDGFFRHFLEELIYDDALPPSVIVKLLERVTEKAAVIYLMPNEFFCKKYSEIKAESRSFGYEEIRRLAQTFGVSVQTTTYRIQELNL